MVLLYVYNVSDLIIDGKSGYLRLIGGRVTRHPLQSAVTRIRESENERGLCKEMGRLDCW